MRVETVVVRMDAETVEHLRVEAEKAHEPPGQIINRAVHTYLTERGYFGKGARTAQRAQHAVVFNADLWTKIVMAWPVPDNEEATVIHLQNILNKPEHAEWREALFVLSGMHEGQRPNARQIGYVLRTACRGVVGAYKIEVAGRSRVGTHWRRVRVNPPPALVST